MCRVCAGGSYALWLGCSAFAFRRSSSRCGGGGRALVGACVEKIRSLAHAANFRGVLGQISFLCRGVYGFGES